MIMIKFSFIYLLILSLVLGINKVQNACSKGTLKCDLKLSEPTLCDFKNGYVLNSNTKMCEQFNINGCLIYDFTENSEHKCFLCDKEMILDENSLKCVKVLGSVTILNCFFYQYFTNNCLECAPQYFLKNNSCVSIGENKIDNCLRYSDDIATCSACEDGYALKNGICQESNLIHNCLIHTNIFCDECNEDYFKSYSKSSAISISSSFITDLVLGRNNSPIINNQDNLHPVCLKKFISNCKIQQSDKKCEKCETGYMLKANGLCEEIPKEKLNHCLVYSSYDTCTKCNDDYYVGSDNKCFKRSMTLNCQTYHDDSDLCDICEKGYYLESPSFECVKVTGEGMDNCKINHPYQNLCQVCEYGYDLSGFSTSSCIKLVNNCAYMEIGLYNDDVIPTVECHECDYGFYLDDNKCYPFQGTEFCTHYDFQTSSCITCETSYSLSDGKCEMNFGGDGGDGGLCIDLLWDYCFECVNLYYVNIFDECQKITNYENCTYSDGFDDQCLMCNIGYELSAEGVCVLESFARASKEFQEDENSLCNSDESDITHYSCSSCKSGGKLIYGNHWFKNKEHVESLKCAKVTSNGEGCDICKPFHKFVNGHCTSVDPSTSDCKIYKGYEYVDGDSTPCDICNFEIGYGMDIDSNSCKLRTNPSTYFDCQNYLLENIDSPCNKCIEDSSPLNPGKIFCLKLNEFQNFAKSITNNFNLEYSSIENCLIVDFDLKCHTCNEGYYSSSDRLSCIKISSSSTFEINPSFDSVLNITKSIYPSSEIIANCVKYSVINDHFLGCSECASNYVGIVEIQNSASSANFNLIETINGKSLGPNTSNPFIKCELRSNAALLQDGNAHVETFDCNIGVLYEEYVGYICIQCIPGKIGTILEIEKDMNNKIFPEATLGLGNCALENTNSLKMDYQGIGYENRFSTSALQLSNFVHFSNCSTENTKLFYMIIINPIDHKINWVDKKLHDGSDLKEAYCWNPSESLISSSVIDNCEIYSLKSLATISVNSTNNSLDGRCIACSPGYKATLNNGVIESCEAINDCSFLSNWLNSCSSPANNSWYAEQQDSIFITKYDDPIPLDKKISNCILIDLETKSKCLMCGEGYSTNTFGECSKITIENSHCSDPSIGFTGFPKTDSLTLQNKQIMGNYYSRYFSISQNKLTSSLNSFCNSCDENMILVHLAQNANQDLKICGKNHMNESVNADMNCKYFNFNEDTNICDVCKTGYALNLVGECVEFQGANCKTVNDFNECIRCLESYEINASGECVPLNCKVFTSDTQTNSSFLDKGQCQVCEDNHILITHYYQPTETEIAYCAPNPDPDSECLNYGFSPGYCVKCKDPNKVNFIFEDISTTTEISQSCIENLRTQRFYHFIHLDYFAFKITSSTYINLVVLSIPDAENRSYSQLTNIDSSAYWIDFCVSSHNVSNCKAGGIYEDPTCTTCEDTYFLQISNNSCNLSSLSGCKIPNHNDESCFECSSGFYMEDGVCKERVNSLNICKTENSIKDECESCFEGISYLSDNKLCMVYTAANCFSYSPDSNSCLDCVDGHHLVPSENDPNISQCIELASIQCKVYSKELERCVICVKGYFVNDSICQEYSVSNCEVYNRNADSCLICKNGFYLSFSGDCVENTKDIYCRLYEFNKEGCKICRDGYLLNKDTLVCHKNPTGIVNCLEYNIDNTCKTCKSEFFLNENECEPVSNTIASCKYYKSATECQDCLSNFVLVNNVCREIEAVGCNEYLSHNQCKNCKSGYYYDKESTECLRISIEFCTEVNPFNFEICLKCNPPYILKVDQSGCKSPSTHIPKCEEYYDSNTCIKCEENYFLSVDGKSCLHNEQYLNHSNCSYGSEKQNLSCLRCKDGYYLASNNKCYQIPMKGCFSLDWNSNICLLCYPGYYMDEFGLCHESA